MKRILKYSIILFLVFALNLNSIKANFVDPNKGSSSDTTTSTSGGMKGWFKRNVGLKISIIGSDNAVKATEIFLNNEKLSNAKKVGYSIPKNLNTANISWLEPSSYTYTTTSELPSTWEGGINFYNFLTNNNYNKLKKFLENSTNLKNTLDSIKQLYNNEEYSIEYYIVVEPMIMVNQIYGTAYELSHYFAINDSAVFNKNPRIFSKTGAFYTTIFLETSLYNLNPSNGNSVDCFKNSTCGRGVGIFKYTDVYDTDEIVPESSEEISCLNANIKDINYNNCTVSIEVVDNIPGLQKFYSKTGRFLIKKNSDNHIEIFDSEYRKVIITNPYIASATITKTCTKMSTSGYPNPANYSDIFDLSIYFNNLEQPIDSLTNYKNSETINTWTEPGNCISWGIFGCVERETNYYTNFKWTYNYDFKYNLDAIKMENLTGKVSNSGVINTNGIISKFTETSGTIPFKVNYSTASKSSVCEYETKDELIIQNGMELEFRTIDSKLPFNRETKSNWCGTDCNKDNDVVNTYIKDSANSYGLDNAGNRYDPIYIINLNSTNVKNIKEYNQTHPYDQNNMEEVNNFLLDMKNKGILEVK